MEQSIDFYKLAESIGDLEKLKTKLIENGVMTRQMLQSATTGCRSVEDEKLHIVLEFKKKSPEALKKFFSCLVEAEQSDAAKIMDPSYQVPIKNLHNTRDDTTDASDATVCVQQAKHYVVDDEKCVYRMKSSPKGYALVIVNLTFARHPYRHGAEMDCPMLTSLLQGLGYRVSAYFNRTSHEMEEIAKNFAAIMDFSSVDSCIVAISTHGEGEFLLGSDSKYMKRERIIEPFNNKHCPKLTHKPKLFFFQACRGSKYDDGVLEGTDGLGPTKIALFTDMWIFYSTIPEYVSWRNRNQGSRFIVAVTEVFSKYAWNTPLEKLYIKVDEMMQDLGNEPCCKAKQVPELAKRSFRKDLYFNPGLNETIV